MNAPIRPTTRNTVYSVPSCSAPARISSFDQKPASGNRPMSAAVQMTKVQYVLGMNRFRPPMSSFMSKECTAWATEPDPRNSPALNMAWVKRWNIAAVQAPTPSAITM